ncbi:MAG TPA: hypothetical protein VFG91_14205 [Woeseiaceae bacterium]|nr:hypothetical protein [Woeseiaceae bacterium]
MKAGITPRIAPTMAMAMAAILLAGTLHAEPNYDFLPLALDPGQEEFPEGIAVDHRGNLYFSLAPRGEIWGASPGGKVRRLAVLDPQLPPDANGVLGLAEWKGDVYAALMACNAEECNDTHGVWRIRNGTDGHGQKHRLAGTEHIPFPNALAFGRHGELYVSDSLTGAVWVLYRLRDRHPGNSCRHAHDGPFSAPEIWRQHEALRGTGDLGLGAPIGANGIAYSRGSGKRRDEILAANTERGSLLAIPVRRDGAAGEPAVVAQDIALVTVDGITVDRYGDVFALTVARIGPSGLEPVSRLLHVDRATGEIRPVLEGAPLHFSTSLAFGRTPATEESVFVTNWALLAPLFGLAPEPAIVRVDLDHSWFVVDE